MNQLVKKLQDAAPVKILTAGFMILILLGSFLLSLPAASRSHESISFLNALFEATSAVCVTGLVVFDTWTQFSFFGQAVLLVLIQIGGLGFVTVAFLFLLSRKKKIGLRQKSLLMESFGILNLAGIIPMVKMILKGTFLIELLGAVLLSVRFIPLFGVREGIWYSVFHAVSAFCNAGFDLFGFRSASSLITFRNDPLVILTISGLILTGGLGFVVWSDLLLKKFRFSRLNFHSKTVLQATVILLTVPTVMFTLSENNGALAGLTNGEKVLNALFLAVTPRTAGFSNIDLAGLSAAGKVLMTILMMIGAAPGSTGGGLKITTAAVLFATVRTWMKGGTGANIPLGRYRIDPQIISRAFVAFFLYLAIALAGTYILCACGESVEEALFECFSAIGTVGVSLGITSALAPLSKITIISMMFFGRLGSLTVFLALNRIDANDKLKNPVGSIIIG
ncbi:MAG: TrkH family potassium uptake protein [Solobacterium sp.]|nr:TrkH family potassium uptake protein [Solobacterium sp.]